MVCLHSVLLALVVKSSNAEAVRFQHHILAVEKRETSDNFQPFKCGSLCLQHLSGLVVFRSTHDSLRLWDL